MRHCLTPTEYRIVGEDTTTGSPTRNPTISATISKANLLADSITDIGTSQQREKRQQRQ